MKKLIPITVITLALFLNSCGLKEVVGPNAEGGTTNSDSYQPVTKNSTWKYSIQVSGETALQTANITMTGDNKNINGTVFFKALETSGTDSSIGYFGRNGSTYFSYSDDDSYAVPYLDDTKAAGDTYKQPVVDPAAPSYVTAQYLLTILEKNITKTIGGKTYNNVIHTRSELQYSTNNSPFQTVDMSEYYVAKGIGPIEVDAFIGTTLIAKQTITSYNIK